MRNASSILNPFSKLSRGVVETFSRKSLGPYYRIWENGKNAHFGHFDPTIGFICFAYIKETGERKQKIGFHFSLFLWCQNMTS